MNSTEVEMCGDCGGSEEECVDESHGMDCETYQRGKALADMLSVDVAELEPTDYSPCYGEGMGFQVSPRRIKRGTSPEEARRLVDQLRKSLRKACSNRFKHEPDTDKWTVDFLANEARGHKAERSGHGGDYATYGNIQLCLRAVCPEDLEKGIHEVLNTLYFLSPETDNSDHAAAHKASLREAFDGQEVQDRRESAWTNSGEYAVLTDDEADTAWDAALESYIDDCMEIPEGMENYFDREAWKRDARMDGRAHAIGTYDGTEQAAEGPNGQSFVVFRTN